MQASMTFEFFRNEAVEGGHLRSRGGERRASHPPGVQPHLLGGDADERANHAGGSGRWRGEQVDGPSPQYGREDTGRRILEDRGIGKDRASPACRLDGDRLTGGRSQWMDGQSPPHGMAFEKCSQGDVRSPAAREDRNPIARPESPLPADLPPRSALDVPDQVFPAERPPGIRLEQDRLAVAPAAGRVRPLHTSEYDRQDYHLDCRVHAAFMRGTA